MREEDDAMRNLAAWASQVCCHRQEPSKETTAGASEAKLQAKVQITAAVGSRCGPCVHARDCRRLDMVDHPKCPVPLDAYQSGNQQVDLD